MVQSVSISNVSPCVRSSTTPDVKPMHRCGKGRQRQACDRLGPDAVKRQKPDGVGSSAKERRMAERDDAGVAKREIKRKREQNGDRGARWQSRDNPER